MALQTAENATFAANRMAIVLLYSAGYRYSRQFRPRFQEQSTGTFGTEIKATPQAVHNGGSVSVTFLPWMST